jgi:hypothetical protein
MQRMGDVDDISHDDASAHKLDVPLMHPSNSDEVKVPSAFTPFASLTSSIRLHRHFANGHDDHSNGDDQDNSKDAPSTFLDYHNGLYWLLLIVGIWHPSTKVSSCRRYARILYFYAFVVPVLVAEMIVLLWGTESVSAVPAGLVSSFGRYLFGTGWTMLIIAGLYLRYCLLHPPLAAKWSDAFMLHRSLVNISEVRSRSNGGHLMDIGLFASYVLVLHFLLHLFICQPSR